MPEDADEFADDPKTREHGGRFDGPHDAMEQFEEIDEAQREVKSNKGKLKGKKIIDSTEKSKQRDRNALKELEGLSPDEIKEALEE